ncbi:MAG: UTP--glucose-1-phosphate uridylyltransferase [Deltaproteobacteria bacterium]|nr:MAG: UTP--glucose-1-phosphate uridylyltransferase [Deltaproteobacteria bacterium]
MRIRKAVFPVAGLGTRFLPVTKALPKEMLPVVDKPLIQYAVEEARASGIEQIIFVTGRGKGALTNHFDRSYELESTLHARGKEDLLKELEATLPKNGTIVYTRQQEPLGLGHAIWCAKDVVGDEPFAVMLADDLILSDEPVLGQMIQRFDRLRGSVVAVMEVDPSRTGSYGILDGEDIEDQVVVTRSLVEKPAPEKAPSNLAIIGRYILTPAIFDILGQGRVGAGGEIQLTDAMAKLLQAQPIFGYRFNGTRFDCGDKAGFQMANLAFSMAREEIRASLQPFLQEMVARYEN